MKVWSEGLGKTELIFSLHTPTNNRGMLVIQGITSNPVKWKLHISIMREDVRPLIGLMFTKQVLSFFFSCIWNFLLKTLHIRRERQG